MFKLVSEDRQSAFFRAPVEIEFGAF